MSHAISMSSCLLVRLTCRTLWLRCSTSVMFKRISQPTSVLAILFTDGFA